MNLKKYFFIVILLFFIFLISGVHASYKESNPNYYSSLFSSSSNFFGTNEFYGNRDYCNEGQDFLLQISPLSCTPAVVRSDLLEEQDVPVFCPMTSIKLNPLIKIETINSITFGKQYDPKDISGIGFHPYRGALSSSRTSFMNENANQVYNDQIGYVVIWLRQNKNESSMPEFVGGNISARLRYDAENIFGLKGNSFYLPLLTEDEWENNMKRYSFWEGRGYLRAEEILSDKAEIALYSSVSKTPFESSNSQKKLLFRTTLGSGETSNKFFLPGYGCNAGFKVKLDSIETPDRFIKLKINSEYIDVKEGEKFLDGNCYVQSDNIENYGLVKKVVLSCNSYSDKNDDGDESDSFLNSFGGRKSYVLSVSPKFKISVKGVSKSYNVGEFITDAPNKRKVFLAYAGVVKENNKEVLKTLIISVPEDYVAVKKSDGSIFLRDSELDTAENYVEAGENSFWDIFKDENKILLSYADNEKSLEQLKFKLEGFGNGEDFVLDDKTEENYKNSFDDLEIVIDKHAGQKYPYDNEISLDKEAYKEKIHLAILLEQKSKALSLCNEYEKDYPNDAGLEECKDKNKLLFAGSALIRDETGRTYVISLEDIYEPTFLDYGVELVVKNLKTSKVDVLNLLKNKEISLESGSNYYVKLNRIIDEKTADISFNLPDSNLLTRTFSYNLEKDKIKEIEKSYQVSIKKIYLKRYARVSIIPEQKYRESEATFSFKINIEKRNIQLAPEKIESKIKELNKTIEKWNKISNSIGDFVKTMKTACLATEATLTVKHLLLDSGGKSIARTEVMKGNNGWNKRCAEFVADKTYKSLDECYYKNSGKIDAEVDLYFERMSEQNREIKDIQNEHISSESSLFGGKSIDTNAFTEDYSQKVKQTLTGTIQVQDPNDPNKKINVNLKDYQKYLEYNLENPYNIDLLKEIDLYNRLVGTSEGETKKIYEQNLYDVLNEVKSNSEAQSQQTKLKNKYGFEVISANLENKKSNKIEIGNSEIKDFEDIKSNFDATNLLKDDSRVVIVSNVLGGGKEYLFELNEKNEIIRTYSIIEKSISVYYGSLVSGAIGQMPENPNPFEIIFEVRNSASYKNKYLNAELRYYETGPYKGLPALVPFDLNNGWYVYIEQKLPVGGTIESYSLSGVVTSYNLCNVGKNGMEEFSSAGHGDDICQLINKGIGQPYDQFHDLDEKESREIVSKAERAIAVASNPNNIKNKKVNINNHEIKVGEPALNILSTQCTDYMSPKECQLMFNVCDPVICPSSRCDFGGAYPVNDVIQSGIIGSLVLCLPNFKEGVYIPVCLTGVKAGIDGWLSVLESYQGCLQENLETGSTIGICDEINSIYMCEFFWRQAFPIAKLAIPKIMGLLAGQTSRGGGEYMGVQSAWQNAQNSLNYFTQNYALNSFNAFKYRSTEQVGADVCKSFVSLSYPGGADILDQLTEPDSPSQFHGRFDEIPFSTVTNPPISHYKVFYHIYSGNDRGAYYRVYLRGGETGNSYYQSLGVGKMVASGYIGKGEYKTETLDFTAPSGFKELCINVNGDEECGFAQVSTDFAVDYIKDKYIDSQVNQKDIKTEGECISGTPNVYSLLNPNVQEGVDELINPKIYNKGIVRICATENPGSADVGNYETNEQRWIEKGYCGDRSMKCWLDRESVSNAFEFQTNAEIALEKATNSYINEMLSNSDYIDPKVFDSNVSYINSMNSKTIEDKNKKIEYISKLLPKVFFVNEIGKLYLMRGIIYGEIAILDFGEYKKELEKEKIEEAEQENFVSEWFEYNYGRGTFFGGSPDACFKYFDKTWKYFFGECPGDEKAIWISAKNTIANEYSRLDSQGKILVDNLAISNYRKGVWVLATETLKGEEITSDSERRLSTRFTTLLENGVFYFDDSYSDKIKYPQIIYVLYRDKFWMWSLSDYVSEPLNSAWLKTPKLAENPEDEENVLRLLKESHDRVVEHYEETIIKDLGDSSMNFEKGILYLFEGKFVKEMIKSEEKEKIKEILGEINSCQKNVLDALEKIKGKSKEIVTDLDKRGDINCHDSVLYIYKEANVEKKCVYSDNEGKIYKVDGKELPATKNDDGAVLFVNPNSCENKNLGEFNKLDLLKPGYMLSVYYGLSGGKPAPHNVIFVDWVDKSNNIAKIFDWGAFSHTGIFEYSNLDLSDNAHPVYMFWKPIPIGNSCSEEIIQSGLEIEDEKFVSPIFELQDGTWNENICYRFFSKKWHWFKGCDLEDNEINYLQNLDWIEIEQASKYTGLSLKDSVLMNKLKSEGKYYKDGLEILVNEVIGGNRGSWFSDAELITKFVSLSEEGVLTLNTGGINSEDRKKFYSKESVHFLYVNNEWFFSLSKGTYDEKDLNKFKNAKSTDAQIEDEDDIWRRPKYLKEGTNILSDIEEEIINKVWGMNKIMGIKYLFGFNSNLQFEESVSTDKNSAPPASSATISLEESMIEIRDYSNSEKYSNSAKNKEFIDKLYRSKILTEEEYKDINGEGFWNIEEPMILVKGILIDKKIAKNNGKWDVLSAWLKCDLLGSDSYRGYLNEINAWKRDEVIQKDFESEILFKQYGIKDPESDNKDISEILKKYFK